MDAQALSVATSMATTTIAFLGDVVTNLWPLLLSIGVLAFVGGFVLRKLGMGRT